MSRISSQKYNTYSLDVIAVLILSLSVLLVALLLIPAIGVGLLRGFITIVALPLLALDFSFFLFVIAVLLLLLEGLALYK